MNNHPPFYVGQKVVAVSSVGKLVKGREYIVLDLVQCPTCKKWQVGYTQADGDETHFGCTCGFITTKNFGGPYRFVFSHRFAPIEENTYEDCTRELAKLPVEETPDVKKIKELVN